MIRLRNNRSGMGEMRRGYKLMYDKGTSRKKALGTVMLEDILNRIYVPRDVRSQYVVGAVMRCLVP
jgi:hypothetical protein